MHGIGDAKLTKFGERFSTEIESYCRAHGLSTDVPVDPARSGSDTAPDDSTAARPTRPPQKISRTKQAAFEMFAKGATLDDVMAALARARSTAAGYLNDFIGLTKPTSIETWVSEATYLTVARAADQVGTERLKPIFEHLDEKVPYDDIRLVLTHLEIRTD
ncbi:MAG: helix-turn-helix domain-containing protein [Phycisphaerae bacterium]